jgi:hypothetical protein
MNPETLTHIRKLFVLGLPLPTISDLLGVDRPAVHAALHGLTRRRVLNQLTAALIRRVAELWHGGLSFEAIRKELGISLWHVTTATRAAGLPVKRGPRPANRR